MAGAGLVVLRGVGVAEFFPGLGVGTLSKRAMQIVLGLAPKPFLAA